MTLAAAIFLAAIVTVRNDTRTVQSDMATFTNGIASRWIPYGTYTDGVGSSENLRVSSNLVGVVYSVIGGVFERSDARDNADYPVSSRPAYTNSTRLTVPFNVRTNRTVSTTDPAWVRDSLAWVYAFPPPYAWHNGIARSFGGDVLDELTGNASVPIPTAWTALAPFSDTNAWVNVWPVYGACPYDGVIFATNAAATAASYERDELGYFLKSWNNWSFAGADVAQSASALVEALEATPLAVSVPDVLSHDTGFTATDYAHWTNETLRLDWKRLGLFCQFERHLETGYKAVNSDANCLTGTARTVTRTKSYKGSMSSTSFTVAADGSVSWDDDLDDVSWEDDGETVATNTRAFGPSIPTARCDAPASGIRVSATTDEIPVVVLTASEIAQILKACAEATFETGTMDGRARFYFYWTESWPMTYQMNFYAIEAKTEEGLLDRRECSFSWSYTEPTPKTFTYPGFLTCSRRESKSARNAFTEYVDRAAYPYWGSYPLAKFWNEGIVESVGVPALEAMVSATGCDYGESSGALDWDTLDATQRVDRLVRMNPRLASATCATARAVTNNVSYGLSDLNDAVLAKFRTVSGNGLDLAARTQWDAGEHDRLAALAKASAGASVTARTWNGGRRSTCWIEADLTWTDEPDGSVSVTVTPLFMVHNNETWLRFPVTIMYLSFAVESEIGSGVVSSAPSARVDGHSSTMSVVKWQFNNMRGANE